MSQASVWTFHHLYCRETNPIALAATCCPRAVLLRLYYSIVIVTIGVYKHFISGKCTNDNNSVCSFFEHQTNKLTLETLKIDKTKKCDGVG